MRWKYYPSLPDIPVHHLYQILKLRQDVFIIEQNCIYEDIDLVDHQSEHLLLVDDQEQLIGYLRIVPGGEKFKEWSLGRIAVRSESRGKQYGKKMIEEAIDILDKRGIHSIRIEAQAHLLKYYKSFGFQPVSEVYSVDDIPHLQMLL